MNSTKNPKPTPIQQFYSGTKILITGATGFFGMILLEKLLRSCPDITTIYILIRQKTNTDWKTRMKKITDQVVFERLKAEQPNFADKIVGVNGDCALPNLGLDHQSMELLKKEIDIVFHLAATINLNEDLKPATFINIRATRDLISLAKGMPNLKVFMHVSTAYSNCILKVIEEKWYPPAFDANVMITMAEQLPNSILENITDILLGGYYNTYSFTKQMAEAVVEENAIDLPIGIHRPSITLSTYKEPVRSWVNSMHSASGLIAFASLGVLRIVYTEGSVNSGPVPVDMCMNSLIAAAWDTAAAHLRAKRQKLQYVMPIYHYISCNVKPITWKETVEKSHYNSEDVWFHFCLFHSNVYVCKAYRLLLHTIPAMYVDLIGILSGKSPKVTNMYSKIHKLNDAVSAFSTRQWAFESNNVKRMIDKMSDEDRDIFFCDLSRLDWDEFFKTFMEGIQMYPLKDKRKQKGQRNYLTVSLITVIIGATLSLFLWIFNGQTIWY